MAKEISEKSLYKRIPLSHNKDELYDLSISLNKMFDRLQYSFKRQKEFIGNASHELRSPITLLIQAQEEMLMNDNLPSQTNKKLVRQLDTTRRMSHMVRNLLDLSRLEQQETLSKKSVDMAILTNQGVLLEVMNKGYPIPEDDLDLVFEQFYKMEKSRSADHGGSGLGLAIAKKIVELHNGTICITNETQDFIKLSVFLPF